MLHRNQQTSKTWMSVCFLFGVVFLLVLSLPAFGADPPKEILSANITLNARWEDSDCQGEMEINIHGQLKLNRQFSSLEQSLPALMVPYKATAMKGNYRLEHKSKKTACGIPETSYEDSGTFTIEPVPGPGNLVLHYMGGLSEQLAQVRHMAPGGAFDTLIDRYFFSAPIPGQDVRGTRIVDRNKCITEEITASLSGTIKIHFEFNKDGTMSGRRSWSCDANYRTSGADANVAVSNLPDVFNEKPFAPAQSPAGKVRYELRWEIKEPSIARILLEEELPSGEKAWKDITDNEAEITVGKLLRFKGVVLPEGKVNEPTGDWTLEGDGGGKHKPYFKEYKADKFRGKVIELDPESDLKNKHMITLFWSGGKEGAIRFKTSAGGEDLSADARLKIIKPNYRLDVVASKSSSFREPETGVPLDSNECWGGGARDATGTLKWFLQYDGIIFEAENLDKGKIDGDEQWVQILLTHFHDEKYDDGASNPWILHDALDTCYPYKRGPVAEDMPGFPLGIGPAKDQRKKDDDGSSLMKAWVVHDCRMVLMFRPEGKKGEIDKHIVAPPEPRSEDTDTFPEWEKNCGDPDVYGRP